MADNTILNLGTGGDLIASDDIAGVKHQRVKVEWGADGTATEVADADGSRLPVKVAKAATATRTSVADSLTSVTILAANTNRKGAIITNDSTALLYIGLGLATATTTNYTTTLNTDGTYVVPDAYTGIIVGIWATAPGTGGARVTELT